MRSARTRRHRWLVLVGALVCACSEKRVPASAGSADSGAADPAERIARAAAVIGSCAPDDGVNRNAAHLWNSHGPRVWNAFALEADCLSRAGAGCRAMQTCFGWTLAAGDHCSRSCNGSVADFCGEGTHLTLDCASLEMRCDLELGCVRDPVVPCDRNFAMGCTSDGAPEYCDGVVYRDRSCASLGMTCEAGTCVGSGALCSASGTGTELRWNGIGCDGAALRACMGGHEATLDCAQAGPGFSCQSFDRDFFCGLASECLPGEQTHGDQRGSPVTCQGTALEFCNAGRIERTDCTSLGFEGCDATHGVCSPSYFSILAPQ